ncbi:hypothetical protein BO71DRAFT_434961 [Aspergillus ellipticus CBS 707.79]|uniref:Uncharacterized protein n=1 Tax=Aspergillus ellipticus CBS 707.79 TaxID=1448320 RepID=A0A319CWP1_9EURO|nr:hypothetical protein BO71DRAFT_434961 [Aspergillus ellipticus CBS 707.79]
MDHPCPLLTRNPTELILIYATLLDPKSYTLFAVSCKALYRILGTDIHAQARLHALPDPGYYKRYFTELADGKLRPEIPDDIDTYDGPFRLTPSRFPAQNIFDAIARKKDRAVASYLKAGVDPDAYNLHGQRMLHFAGREANAAIIDLLVRYGADPNKSSAGLEGPVMDRLYGFFRSNIPQDVAIALARAGGKFSEATFKGICHWSYGAQVIKAALEGGFDLRAGGVPYLCLAARQDNSELLEMFLEHDPEILNQKNRQAQSAFDCALDLFQVDNAVYLLRRGIELQPDQGPLMKVVDNDFRDVAKELLKSPELDEPEWTHEIRNSLQWASRWKRMEMLDMLVQRVKGTEHVKVIEDFSLYEKQVDKQKVDNSLTKAELALRQLMVR